MKTRKRTIDRLVKEFGITDNFHNREIIRKGIEYVNPEARALPKKRSEYANQVIAEIKSFCI